MDSYELPSIKCCYSSLLFITNVVICYCYKYYLYSLLFFGLTISSLIHHSHKTLLSYWIDKFFVFSVVGYGGYVFYNKFSKNIVNIHYSIITLISFLGTIILYYYGSLKKCFVFAEDINECDNWHQLLHLLSSLGHHFIIFM
jgi:cation transport ATPase